MTVSNPQASEKPYEIVVLDDLIEKAFEILYEEMKDKPKLGDLLKMIELRRKLLPNEEDQKQFWIMLEGIRRKNLAEKKSDKSEKTTRPKRTTRRPKAGKNA